MTPDIPAYLLSWSREFEARSDRVRQLIGDAHWLSDGHHKEWLLQEFLVRYLPPSLCISRGFVKATRCLDACSPEVDILVSDPILNPPLFFEGGLQIVDSSSVVAQTEVKTKFSKPVLKDALENICRTQSLLGNFNDSAQVWKGVCFFVGGVDREPDSLHETLEAALREVALSLRAERVEFVAPTCIALLDRYCCFINQTASTDVTIKTCDVGGLAFACAFADMFSALRRKHGGAVLGGLDNVIDSLQIPAPTCTKLSI
jgi:hypothetical protein